MDQSQLTNRILDQSKDLIWVVNLHFQLLYANNTYFKIMKDFTGVEKKLNDSVFVEAFFEEDVEKWKTYYNRAIAGEYFNLEEHYFHPNLNEIQYSEITFEPLKGDDNKIFAVTCQSKDITRIVKQRSEANQLMDASLDVFCSIDEKGNFIYVSAASLNHWGYLPEEITGKPYVNFILEEDVAKTNEIVSAIFIGKEIKSFVNRYKKKDGSIAYNLWSAVWDNNAKLIYCVARDGKEKIEQEEKILQSEQLFKALVHDGSSLITITDFAGNYSYVSPTSTVITGFTPEEFMGRNVLEFIHPDDTERASSSLKKLTIQNRVVLEPFRTKNKNNEWRWAETVLTNMFDNPAVKGIVANTRDITQRIDHEEKIELSELRFKALVQEGSDIIGILDIEGNYIYVSPTSTAILGITPEEFIGRNAFEFIHPDDAERTLVGLQKITTENRVMLEPFRFQNHNKEWRWIGTVLTNMLNNPSLKGIVSNSSDITDKIVREQKIVLSQKRFEALVENSMDCVIIISPEGKTTYVSGSVKKILGYTQAEVMDFNIWELCHPDDIEGSLKALALTMENPGVPLQGYTARIKHKNGTWRWVEPVITNLLHDSAINGIVDNFRDITEKKEEEQRLKLLESVITNTNDAILITEAEPFDEPGPKIIYVNEAFTKMTGYTAAEVIGKSPRILQGPNSNKEELANLGQALRNWEPYEVTIINYKKNGEEFWVNFTITPVADEKGWYTHWIAIERDVTEQKIKELESNLINNIVNIFNQSYDNELKECLTKLCEQITKFGNFDFAELWLTSIDGKTINQITNYVENIIGSAFYNALESIKSHNIGDGMPGYVWEKKSIAIWGILEEKRLTNIKMAAKKAGIETIMGVPLKYKEEVIAVLVLGTEKSKSMIELYSELFQRLELIIGAELSRKKTEIELAQIFNFSPDMICMAGFDGYIKRINPAGLKILGYSLEEMLSRPIKSFIHEDDRLLTTEKQKELYSGRNLRNFENRYITKQGSVVWLSWTSDSIPEQSIVFAVAKNITEEKTLRELNRQTSRVAKIGSWEINLTKNATYWAAMVHNIMETDPKQFLPDRQNFINFFREDFHFTVMLKLKDCEENGTPIDFEVVIVTANKNEKWIRLIGSAEITEGKTIRLFGSIQDINERKVAEEGLIEGEQKYRQLSIQLQLQKLHLTNAQEVAKIGSWETELPNLKVTWSDETYNIFGISKENFDPTHEKFLEFIHPLDREKVDKAFTESFLAPIGSNNIIEHRIITAFGVVKVLEERWKITYNDNGHPLLVIGSCQDITERKNAEILLMESENKFRSLIENSGDMLTLISADGKMEYISPSVEKTFGYTNEENKIRKAMDVVHPDDAPIALQTMESAFKNPGVPLTSIIRNRKKDGTYIWVEGTITNMLHVPGVNAIVANIRDITERKKTQEEKNNLLATIENSLNEIYIFDAETLFFNYINKGALLNLGYSEHELKELTPLDLNPDYTDISFKQLVSPLVNNEKDKIIFFTNHKRKDGSHYPVEVHLQLVKEGNNKFFLSIVLNITERKKAEESIIRANERFEKVTEATNDAIWDWDMVNHTYYRSKAIERFFGKKSSNLFMENGFWKDNFHPEDFSKIQKSIIKAITDPSCNRWELEYRVLNKQKKTLYVANRGIIIRDSEGKAIRIVGAMSDISEQKSMTIKLSELNQSLQKRTLELERSNEELEQFAFVASHDLQEPLRMVSSFMEQLERKYGNQLDQKAHQYIHFATDGAKRMKQIILDLLEYSRASKPIEAKEEVDLNKVLSEYNQLRRKIISEKLALITSKNLPILNTYKAAIVQIFHCLLDNALKYSVEENPPIVMINAVENEKEWEFSIKDNGIGIDSQFYEKIFVIFQRLHNKDDYAGTGIGLSIAKRHVEFLGGRIWLASKLGEGTVFYFTISKTK